MPKGTQRHRRQGSYAQQHQQVRGEELCSYGLGDTPSSSECGPLLTVAPDLREMIVPRDFTPSPTPSPPNQPRTTVPPTPTVRLTSPHVRVRAPWGKAPNHHDFGRLLVVDLGPLNHYLDHARGPGQPSGVGRGPNVPPPTTHGGRMCGEEYHLT